MADQDDTPLPDESLLNSFDVPLCWIGHIPSTQDWPDPTPSLPDRRANGWDLGSLTRQIRDHVQQWLDEDDE
jgi:hypothetical protein